MDPRPLDSVWSPRGTPTGWLRCRRCGPVVDARVAGAGFPPPPGWMGSCVPPGRLLRPLAPSTFDFRFLVVRKSKTVTDTRKGLPEPLQARAALA